MEWGGGEGEDKKGGVECGARWCACVRACDVSCALQEKKRDDPKTNQPIFHTLKIKRIFHGGPPLTGMPRVS